MYESGKRSIWGEGLQAMTMATIRDVAREAGVSVASASRALNGHSTVTEDIRRRVVAAVHKLDYVPHSGARSLTTKRSNTIGVVLPDLYGEFFSEIIRGIDSAARRRGLQLLLSNIHGSAHETAGAIRTMRGRVDGLLIMSPHVDVHFLSHNLPAGLPAVVINGRVEGSGHASVSIDNHRGARTMVEHLVAQGCQRIAHIAGPTGNNDAQERLQGFIEGVKALLGDGKPLILRGDFSEESGHAAGCALVAGGVAVDGIFAANDMMAVGCLAALAEAGTRVPNALVLAGFDDVPIARYVTPALTTMRVNIAELGSRVFERLINVMDHPEVDTWEGEQLVPELVVRQSTQAFRPSP